MDTIERDRDKFYAEQGKFCRHSLSYGEKFNEVPHKIWPVAANLYPLQQVCLTSFKYSMKKLIFSAFMAALFVTAATAQKIGTKDAKVSFDATSSLEQIRAVNNSGSVAMNTATGDVAARVLIKNFIFKQALMQEHFNENYLESNKFPNATLKGKISNLSEVKFDTDGTYKGKIAGTLEMHGVTKPVEVPATFTVKGGKVAFKADLTVVCADYGIAIPSVVADKVAKEAKISVEGTLSN